MLKTVVHRISERAIKRLVNQRTLLRVSRRLRVSSTTVLLLQFKSFQKGVGGTLGSELSSEKNRWVRTDAAIAGIWTAELKIPLKIGGVFSAAASERITAATVQAILRQHVDPCTPVHIIWSPPANNSTPTSKKLILSNGQIAVSQAAVFAIFEPGWYPNLQHFA
jgi:hypothetical protein